MKDVQFTTTDSTNGGSAGGLWPPMTSGPDAGVLQGWIAPDPLMPNEPCEVGLDVSGLGIHVVLADILPPQGSSLPAGSRVFRWRPPSALANGQPKEVRAWHLATGEELAGSPTHLPPMEPATPRPEASAPLRRWTRNLAGHLIAATAQELAEGVWVSAQGQAMSFRYELLPVGGGGDRLRHGVRLLAEAGAGRFDLHFRPAVPLPAAGTPVPIEIEAWLPSAAEPVVQAQAELWLTVRSNDSFIPLRRIRRLRVFRRPSVLKGELLLTEKEAAGELWLTFSVAAAQGICVLPPILEEETVQEARMEDARLEGSFGALAELVRLHGEARRASHPLLPPGPPPGGAALCVTTDAATDPHPFTQIIVPVYNGDNVVRDCLRALRTAATGPCEVVVVDDGSRDFTAEMLQEEVAGDPLFRLHRRDINRGYTKSINEGVLLTDAPWVVILNSDTIVSHGWLDRLHAAARARPGTGMVGPLSNAATWQSIPAALRADGSWSTNDMIRPKHVERVQALLADISERAYPEFHVLNGFATLISREVFDRVGLYDEDAFPVGYGEETDLCLRARRAGFRLTVADDCFVYHHKSVSFGANRQRLTRAGRFELTNKHLGVNVAALEAAMQSAPAMVRLRTRMAELLAELD